MHENVCFLYGRFAHLAAMPEGVLPTWIKICIKQAFDWWLPNAPITDHLSTAKKQVAPNWELQCWSKKNMWRIDLYGLEAANPNLMEDIWVPREEQTKWKASCKALHFHHT